MAGFEMPTRGGGAAMLRELRDEERPNTEERLPSKERLNTDEAIQSKTEMKERNNEGNFIASPEGKLETTNIPLEEATQETKKGSSKLSPKLPNNVTSKQSNNVGTKQSSGQSLKEASGQSPKQSLKEAVLANGNEREEKAVKTRLNVDIEEDLHIWLKGHAIQNRRKLNDLIPRILKAYRDGVENES